MSWIRLDDLITESPKLDELGPAGSWLYVCALAYCNRNLTDGFLSRRAIGRLGSFDWADPATAELPQRLIDAGLWHAEGHSCGRCPQPSEGQIVIHDYSEYQPSRADVEERRMKERNKKALQRAGNHREVGRDANGRYEPLHAMSPGDSLGDTTVCPPLPNPTQPNPMERDKSLSSAVVTQPPSVTEPDLWETVLTVCQIDPDEVTPSARGSYRRAVTELAHMGATPEDVMDRASRFGRQWPDATLTPNALSRRWAEIQGSSTERHLARFVAGGDA